MRVRVRVFLSSVSVCTICRTQPSMGLRVHDQFILSCDDAAPDIRPYRHISPFLSLCMYASLPRTRSCMCSSAPATRSKLVMCACPRWLAHMMQVMPIWGPNDQIQHQGQVDDIREVPRTSKHTSTEARAKMHRIVPGVDGCSSFQQHIYDTRVSVDGSHHQTCTL